MANMRVYELAKELKIDSKDLLKELIDMGLDVTNHMSVVEQEQITQVQERLKSQRSEVVVEKRVGNRVIRRRRKKVGPESGAPDSADLGDLEDEEEEALAPEVTAEVAEVAAPAAPAAAVEAPAAPEPVAAPPQVEAAPPVEAPPAAPEPRAAAPEAPAPEPAAPVAETPAPRVEAKPEPQAPAAPTAEAAPAAPAPEPPVAPPAPVATAPRVEAKPAPRPEPRSDSRPESRPEPTGDARRQPPRPDARPRPQQDRPRSDGARPEGQRPQGPRPQGDDRARTDGRDRGDSRPDNRDRGDNRPDNRDRRPKKRLEDQPARIISLPTEETARIISRPPERPDRGERPPRPPRPAGPGRPMPPGDGPRGGRPLPEDIPVPPKEDAGRTRKKKVKAKGMPDDEFLMKKAGGRNKEVLERDALYDNKGRGRRKGGPVKKRQKTEVTTPKAIKRRVKVAEAITVGELAKRMGVKAAQVVGHMMKEGMMITSNQSLDIEDANLVATEFGFEVERSGFEETGILERQTDAPEDMMPRPPVVTIMGHVDHGKTSLLDRIRKSKVAEGEAGGITQHIGAYEVNLANGGKVVFLDTPGHEAFTTMRARGAKVTDVVVLVVAADDGVMDQTKEAINHSKAAGVPIVVAVNKIDKPGADPDRARRELSEHGLIAEDWGGETIFVNVSAKTGQGVDTLLEMLQLQTEILELQANPDKPARGYVLEARLDKGRGAVGTVLVHEGTLKNGDAFVCGVHAGKVRALFDDQGRIVDLAGPSIPVEVQGFGGVPEAGDEFMVVENDRVARQVADHRQMKKREAELSAKTKMSLEGFFEQMKEGQVQELKLVVKADVQGSVEALVDALGQLGNELVRVNVIHAATGAITEGDVMLASASEAVIIGFNVRPAGKVIEVAKQEQVEVKTYDVIYKCLEDLNKALAGLLAPEIEEEVIGRVEVRDTFSVPKIGTIAGSYVTSGKVERSALARLLRDGKVIATSKVSSLRRFKEDVKEVNHGYECGIGLENYNDIKVGDEIEFYVLHERAATL